MAGINSHGITPAEPMPIRVPGLIILDSDEKQPQPHDTSKAEAMGAQWRESGEHWERVATWYANRQAAAGTRTANRNTAYTTYSTEGRSISLAGFGARLSVQRGALVIQHGRTYSTEVCTQEVLYRGTHGVSTLIWVTNGGAGQLTLEAIKWCAGQNITIRLLTNRGEHLGTLFPTLMHRKRSVFPSKKTGDLMSRYDDHSMRSLQWTGRATCSKDYFTETRIAEDVLGPAS